MSRTLFLSIEVSGCPTTCMHCWARGARYDSMPLNDIERVLKVGKRVCDAHGVAFSPFPMHEAAAHPDTPQLIELFAEYSSEPVFEPFVTTGVPLTLRADWQAVLEAARKTGTTTLWTHFHGVSQTHDANMNRVGAFDETCLVVERAKALGFHTGCNVFVTRDLARQVDEIADKLAQLRVDESAWLVASYTPHARMRRYEDWRPELADLLPVAERISALTSWPGEKAFWQLERLAECTEVAYLQRALNDSDSTTWFNVRDPNFIQLVCRPSLDLHAGVAGAYGRMYGSLRNDDAEYILEGVLSQAAPQESLLYFNARQLPPIRDLAEKHGNATGQKIHPNASSVAARWLDLAWADRRRY